MTLAVVMVVVVVVMVRMVVGFAGEFHLLLPAVMMMGVMMIVKPTLKGS